MKFTADSGSAVEDSYCLLPFEHRNRCLEWLDVCFLSLYLSLFFWGGGRGGLVLPCVKGGLETRRSIVQRRLENICRQDSEIQKTAVDGNGRVTGTDNWYVATSVQRSRLNTAFSRQDWRSHLEDVNNPGNFLERSWNFNHYETTFKRSSSQCQ